MGFFADAYDLFIIGVAATLITTEWHVPGYQKSLLSSLALLTSAAGAVVFGRIADKLGRRKVYGYEVVVLAAGAVWLRRRIKETPRFLLAQVEARETAERAFLAGQPTGIRGVLAEPRLRRWLVGAGLAWLLFDFVYYGNTISSPMITTLVSPHAGLTGATVVTLAVFAVAALPAYLLAAFTIDKIGRRFMQAAGFAVIAAAFAGLWLVPGATRTLLPFLLLFGATYFFAEFGPNTTTFVYPAEIFPVRVRTTSHGIAAVAGKNSRRLGPPSRSEGMRSPASS